MMWAWTILSWAGILVLGLWFGSYATTFLYRLPRGEALFGAPPHCTECHHRLRVVDYFPVGSYFLTRGMCRYCGVHYPLHRPYFIAELGVCMITVAYFAFAPIHDRSLLLLLMSMCVLVSILMVWMYAHIPYRFILLQAMLGILYRTLCDHELTWVYSVAFTFVGCFFARAIKLRAEGRGQEATDIIDCTHSKRFSGPYLNAFALAVMVGGWLPPAAALWVSCLFGSVLWWPMLQTQRMVHTVCVYALWAWGVWWWS